MKMTPLEFAQAARQLKARAGTRAWTLADAEILREALRQATGRRVNLTQSALAGLTLALRHEGMGVFPPLDQLERGQLTRIYHARNIKGDTTLERLLLVLLHPGPETDTELGADLLKLKGQWEWGPRRIDPAA
ncbi:hypothetical protein [Lolliginicoccus levis]|uniref:hypothetical protein n=1 Tax=Lolliginicoccus levis TaxID=2919542 RepID=UPI00241D5331|nr:hypothetical protein [Lolliginicoccus levis]